MALQDYGINPWWNAAAATDPMAGIMDPSSPNFVQPVAYSPLQSSGAPVFDRSLQADPNYQPGGSILGNLGTLLGSWAGRVLGGGQGGSGGMGGIGNALLTGMSLLNMWGQYKAGKEGLKNSRFLREAAITTDRRNQYDTWRARRASQRVRGNTNFPTWEQWSQQAGGRLIGG